MLVSAFVIFNKPGALFLDQISIIEVLAVFEPIVLIELNINITDEAKQFQTYLYEKLRNGCE